MHEGYLADCANESTQKRQLLFRFSILYIYIYIISSANTIYSNLTAVKMTINRPVDLAAKSMLSHNAVHIKVGIEGGNFMGVLTGFYIVYFFRITESDIMA